MFAVIVLLNHFMSTLFSIFLFVEKQNNLHASFRLIKAELLRESIERHKDELADSFDMR